MEADHHDQTLCLTSSSSSSFTTSTSTVASVADSSEDQQRTITKISAGVHKKPLREINKTSHNESVEKKTPGKQLNFGMETILRLSTDLKSALDPSLMSAFEIVQRPISTGGGGNEGAQKHGNKRTNSRSSTSSSSSTSEDAPGTEVVNLGAFSHLTYLTPYEIFAATKALNDSRHNNNGNGNGSSNNSTSVSTFGKQQPQQQQQSPPTVRSTAAAATVAVNQQQNQQQPSLSSLYQYYASLGVNGGASAGNQLQQSQHQATVFSGTWPMTSAYDASLGTATPTVGLLHKSLPPSPLALFDATYTSYDQGKPLMPPTIESCLSNAYQQLGQQYGTVIPYNSTNNSSSSFYPAYSTLMYMAGQGQGASQNGHIASVQGLNAAQHQQLLVNSGKLNNGGSGCKAPLTDQQHNPIHKPLSSNGTITTASGTIVHSPPSGCNSHTHNGKIGHHHPNDPQQPSDKKGKRSWSRAVFSNNQRRGLEKHFLLQKYITKPDRRNLAESLGLTDAQVKVWFQNRRMKWRHSEEYQKQLLLNNALRQQELNAIMNKTVMTSGKGQGDNSTSSCAGARYGQPWTSTHSRPAPENLFNSSSSSGILNQGQGNLLSTSNAANNLSNSVCSPQPSSPRSLSSSCRSGPVPISPQSVIRSSKSSPVLQHEPMSQYIKPLLFAGNSADLLSVK